MNPDNEELHSSNASFDWYVLDSMHVPTYLEFPSYKERLGLRMLTFKEIEKTDPCMP